MRTLLVVLLSLSILMPLTTAQCCDGYCSDMFRIGTPPTPSGQYYAVEDDLCQPECPFPSLWIYQESNGIEGLQRGDERSDETCRGAIAPDTLIL